MNSIIKKIFSALRGDYFLRVINRTPRILFWHGVDNIVNSEVEAECFSVNDFTKQIEYLRINYDIISLDEFYKRYNNKEFTNKEVVLTFDDGYANNLHIVAPILNKLSIPYTVFISTEHIETGELFPTSIARLIILGATLNKISIESIGIVKHDIRTKTLKQKVYKQVVEELKTSPLHKVRQVIKELIENLSEQEFKNLTNKYKSVKPMTWQEVRQLYQLGATIGSHCKYHICCHENQEDQEVNSQIIDSKKIIEEKLQTECKYFAYPNGDFTTFSNNVVNEAGYKMGFSTKKNQNVINSNDIASIPRIGVPSNIETFKILINLFPKK